jgi:hypothetical protein
MGQSSSKSSSQLHAKGDSDDEALPVVSGFEPGSGRGLDSASYYALQYLRHRCPLDCMTTELLVIIVNFTIGTHVVHLISPFRRSLLSLHAYIYLGYQFLYRWQFNGKETDLVYNGEACPVDLSNPGVSLKLGQSVPFVLPHGSFEHRNPTLPFLSCLHSEAIAASIIMVYTYIWLLK